MGAGYLVADAAVLVSVLVLMAFDYPNGTYTIASIPLIAVLLVLGWFGVRKRVQAEAMKSTSIIMTIRMMRRLNWRKTTRVNRSDAHLRGQSAPFYFNSPSLDPASGITPFG